MKKSEQIRLEILEKAVAYFKAKEEEKPPFVPKENHIPVSGKLLDEIDLQNLIDASLDMWLTTGRFNKLFEKELAEFLGARYTLTVNSGSSANLLALTALTSPKLGDKRLIPGDEVITVAAGFPTTVNPIIQNGCIPVFIDVKPGTYDIDTDQLELAKSTRTRAIMIAHTLGNPFNVEAVMAFAKKYELWVIEDNCDALGSKYNGKYTGTFGHLGTLSFYPAHHITMGEGGAVIVNDNRLYKVVMSLRDWGRDCWCEPGYDNTCGIRFEQQLGNLPYGYDHKYIYSHIGYNLKITDWQAAIGLSQLKKLTQFITTRHHYYNLLYDGLSGFTKWIELPEPEPKSEPSWFGFLITVKEDAPFTKDELVQYLQTKNVGTRYLFAGNILRQPAYLNQPFKFRIKDGHLMNSDKITDEHYLELPITDRVLNQSFWVGVAPLITIEMLENMIEIFNDFFEQFK